MTAPLADPISCPGLVDLLAIIASRTWRDVPLGSMLTAGNWFMLILAVLLLARTIHTITASIVTTMAITLSAAASAVFALTLTPSPAAAFAAVIAAWTALLRARHEATSIARARIALGLLALLAATVVPFMVPALILAAWIGWRWRGIHAALAPVVVLAPSVVVHIAMPQGPSIPTLASVMSCVIPHGGVAAVMEAGRPFISVIGANPVVTALAVLGLLSSKRLPREVSHSLLPLTFVAFWGVIIIPSQPLWTITPFLLAFWILAATGLAEVRDAVSGTAGGRVGAIALSILLVVLQFASTNALRDATLAHDGHDQLSLTSMTTIVGALPRGAGLVEEDAITDLLTRALPSRLRASDRFHGVTRQRDAVTGALTNSRVFALPRSQRLLQYAGLAMIDAEVPGLPGLAEIRQAHACSADLGGAPASLAPLSGRRQFGLVADDERSRGRVLIVFVGDVPLSAGPVGWPRNSTGNIQRRVFDFTVPADRSEFMGEINQYQLASWPRPDTRYATRIEISRWSGAPLVLPVALGDVAKAGTARVLGSSPSQHLRLCPAFPYEVRPLVRRP